MSWECKFNFHWMTDCLPENLEGRWNAEPSKASCSSCPSSVSKFRNFCNVNFSNWSGCRGYIFFQIQIKTASKQALDSYGSDCPLFLMFQCCEADATKNQRKALALKLASEPWRKVLHQPETKPEKKAHNETEVWIDSQKTTRFRIIYAKNSNLNANKFNWWVGKQNIGFPAWSSFDQYAFLTAKHQGPWAAHLEWFLRHNVTSIWLLRLAYLIITR